jgi:hypothetical protein
MGWKCKTIHFHRLNYLKTRRMPDRTCARRERERGREEERGRVRRAKPVVTSRPNSLLYTFLPSFPATSTFFSFRASPQYIHTHIPSTPLTDQITSSTRTIRPFFIYAVYAIYTQVDHHFPQASHVYPVKTVVFHNYPIPLKSQRQKRGTPRLSSRLGFEFW